MIPDISALVSTVTATGAATDLCSRLRKIAAPRTRAHQVK